MSETTLLVVVLFSVLVCVTYGQAFSYGFQRGIQTLLPPPPKVPAKQASSRPARKARAQATVPLPGFDHVDDARPGFEDVPRATLRDMEEKFLTSLNGKVRPGFYDPADEEREVIPWQSAGQ